ncbi:MAG: prepilin peptidase [Pseudomonadota bacterium]
MELETPARAAYAFLPFTALIGGYVCWADLSRMKIPNPAVLALAAVFLVVGPFVLELSDWAWRWTHLLVVLVIGFFMNAARMIGAGDAKYAAAAAPYVAVADIAPMAIVLASLILGAFAAHRIARATPAIRNLAPDWKSWEDTRFPMGLVLGPALVIYLALAAFG